ncbi:MAG: FliM/FliN family flagellar motor switch protein [Planctomycetales bacterium]|nr:FliM/FliN family flagellar motor switch protein [Planctomycetales bacterium]
MSGASTKTATSSSDAGKRQPEQYLKTVLQLETPVSVTIARRRTSVESVLGLAVGQIIKFDKAYDEPLELCAGERTIGEGEVVKLGDRYALRITKLRARCDEG